MYLIPNIPNYVSIFMYLIFMYLIYVSNFLKQHWQKLEQRFKKRKLNL